MKLASEKAAGLWLPIPRELEAILGRLEQLSLGPEFSVQREAALRRVLQIYLEMGPQAPLAPLTEEVELADGWLYADFYPEDGQLTLIEQLRDVITEHIPNEERQWLDPLKHSYMDLVEVLAAEPGASRCRLRSIGNGRLYEVPIEGLAGRVQAGKVLLTRLVREPGDPETTASVGAGPALVLTMEDTRALSDAINDERRQMELVGAPSNWGIGRSSQSDTVICCSRCSHGCGSSPSRTPSRTFGIGMRAGHRICTCWRSMSIVNSHGLPAVWVSLRG